MASVWPYMTYIRPPRAAMHVGSVQQTTRLSREEPAVRTRTLGTLGRAVAACAIAIPFTRSFLALTIPNLSMLVTALLASVFSAAGLWASGYTLDLAVREPDESPPPEPRDSAPPDPRDAALPEPCDSALPDADRRAGMARTR